MALMSATAMHAASRRVPVETATHRASGCTFRFGCGFGRTTRTHMHIIKTITHVSLACAYHLNRHRKRGCLETASSVKRKSSSE